MRRQIRRHSARRSSSSSSRRRLSHLWTRLFHSGGRTRGHALLLDPPGPTQITLGLQSYRTVGAQGPQVSPRSGAGLRDEAETVGLPASCCLATMDLHSYTPESPASPVSFQSEDSTEEAEPSPVSRDSSRAPQSETPTPVQSDSSANSGPSPQEASVPSCPPWASKKLILELAVNLQGVSLRRYSPLGPLSPVSPPAQSSASHPQSQGLEVTSSPEPSPASSSSSSVKAEDPLTAVVPSRERRSRRRRSKSRLCRLSRTFSDEGGESATTPC